jgi:adenylate cyclase
MRSVRTKLVALVLACIVPALLAAVSRARAARSELLDEVRTRLELADDAYLAELEQDNLSDRISLKLLGGDPRLPAALASRDAHAATQLLAPLASTYLDTVIAIADASGQVLASDEPWRVPPRLAPEGALAAAAKGKPVTALLPLPFSGKTQYAITNVEPVVQDGKLLGLVAALTPIDTDYLDQVCGQIGCKLAVKVNDAVIASASQFPAAGLSEHEDGVVLRELKGRLYAVNTFEPGPFQAPGQHVDVTAFTDATELRKTIDRGLWKSLALLGAVLALVLIAALRVARKLGGAVERIGAAADEVSRGNYVEVSGVQTGDELEGLATHFNRMVQGLKERDHLKETFGKYVTRQVADRILQGKPSLGGELVPVTVLFSDIRSFTTISEKMQPKALLDFLNEYFGGMVESVMQHGGVVDKFIGDAIMAVFGAPVPAPDDTYHAVLAALEMRSRLERLNQGFRARGLPEIRTGIGLHSGLVVAGNMGHEERMEYTVIGDAVNLASRLEGMTKELKVDVLLSEDTFRAVEARVEAEPLQKIRVKGREQEVLVYRLIGLRQQRTDAADSAA